MDFLKILKSFEEFVYEALTWLVLLPRTLLRIVLSPRRMTAYASAQLASGSEERYSEAISPPLLLILCVLVSHFIDLAVRNPVPEAGQGLGAVILSSEQNLLLYRTIAFGVWSLTGAVWLLLQTGRSVDRDSLRAPFYEQCYLVAPFALLASLSTTLIALDEPWTLTTGVCLVLGSSAWFWLAQAAWFRSRAAAGVWRSLWAATVVLVVGSVVNAGLVRALSNAGAPPAADAAASPTPANPGEPGDAQPARGFTP